jgi:SH3-like domain-containing protein
LEKKKREVPLIKGAEQPYAKTNNMATLKVSIGRVRKSPSFDSEIIFRLKKGETVLVVETKGNWNRIELRDGRTGWAHQSLFNIAQNTSDLP